MQLFKIIVVMFGMSALLLSGCGGSGSGSESGSGSGNDTTAPTVNTFSMPATATSLTVAVSTFTASDTVGITGYLITESATAPTAGAAGWTASAPTSFTFSAAGTRVAYAWAKDAAGNVSTSRSASVTFTTIKTVTLKFSSQSTNPSDLIGGFNLAVTLPVGSIIPTDNSGVPLPGAVYLSGKFDGVTILNSSYDSALRKLTVDYGSSNSYQLGEFLTVLVTVPSSYVPNTNDITLSFQAFTPLTGNLMPTVTATPTFY